MNITEEITDKELWTLPFESLIEILEQDAMKKLDGMTRDELDIVFEEAMEERKRNCDIKKLAEQTDEENHECIRLNVLQNAVIDKSKEIMFKEDHPDLYRKMKIKNISFKDVEKILCAPKVVNGELIHDEPSFEEVIEYMHYMLVEEGRQASAG
ncbi:MAG: hypothetical protein LJE83_13925 [Gammaproteobacteria bacterium]|nr:hypothetical protein [Gammaproteobacteria bacterium]